MKNPLSTITESLKQGAEALKKKLDDTAKNFKQKFEQAVDKITSSMEWAKKEFETAVNKITAALTWARDELQKAGADLKKSLTELSVVASLNKAGDKLVGAIQGIADRVRQAGKGIKSSDKGARTAPVTGKTGGESSGKTTAPVKNTKKDSPSTAGKKSDTITVSASPKPKSGYQINKNANKNVSVDTKYKPEPKPKPQPKQNRPKRRKEEPKNNNKTQKTRRRGGRKGKAFFRGAGVSSTMSKLDAFSQMATNIGNIQGSVSNILSGVDEAAKSGDFQPLIQELSNMPGAIGQSFGVALKGFQLGKQINKMVMDHGGQEWLYNKTVQETKAMDNARTGAKEYTNLQEANKVKRRINALVENNVISQEEGDKLRINYFKERYIGKKDAFMEVQKKYFTMEEDKANEKRVGSKKLKEMDDKEAQYKEWRKNRQKLIHDAVISGKVKKDSYEYFKMVQDMEDETLKKLIKLKNEFKSLGMKTKTKQMEEAIRNTKSTRKKLSGQAHAAITNQSYAQMGTKEGQTIQNQIKNLEQKREQYLRDANSTEDNNKKKNLRKQAQAAKVEIDNLKVELAKQEKAKAEQTKVAINSGGMQGDQCYEKT